jgi:hypothetical protein
MRRDPTNKATIGSAQDFWSVSLRTPGCNSICGFSIVMTTMWLIRETTGDASPLGRSPYLSAEA